MIAAAYGGEDQLRKSYNSFKIMHWGNEELFPMMLQQVLNSEEVRREREVICKEAKIKSTGELRAFFDANEVMN
jgi:hypothetical protein